MEGVLLVISYDKLELLVNAKIMTVQALIDTNLFVVQNMGNNTDREINSPYCCDLLSIAMGRMPAGSAWITVMANINTLAVAKLADAACILLAEGCSLDDTSNEKAKEQGVTVMCTELPVFEAAMLIYNKIYA